MSARAQGTVAVVIIVLAAIVAYAPTGDPDIWWHLATARLASVDPVHSMTDAFSYSYRGTSLRYRDALAQTILFHGFVAFGFAWLFVCKLLAGAIEAFAMALVQRRRSALVTIAASVLVLATVRIVERPNLFTVALFPLFLALVERARRVWHEAPGATARALGFVVLCSGAWIALHRGGLLSIAMLIALALYATITRVVPRPALGNRPTAAAVGMTWLAALLVLGGTLLSSAAALRSAIAAVEGPALRSSISEWQRLGPLELAHHFPLPIVLAGFALLTAASRVRRREMVVWHVLLLTLFVCATLQSVRWVPYLAVVAIELLVIGWGEPGASVRVPRLSALVTVAGLAWLVADHETPFALGEDASRTPRAAADFLTAHGLEGEVANALELGGYLIWRDTPRVSVLVDGRNETLYPPSFVLRALAAERGAPIFQQMRAEDHATIVVAVNAPNRLSHAFLADDPSWALVAWSDPATVWVHAAEHPELAAHAYRLLDPRSLDGSVARVLARDPSQRGALADELGRMITESPSAVRPLVALAVLDHLTGDSPGLERVMRRLEELAPEHPAVVELRSRLQLAR